MITLFTIFCIITVISFGIVLYYAIIKNMPLETIAAFVPIVNTINAIFLMVREYNSPEDMVRRDFKENDDMLYYPIEVYTLLGIKVKIKYFIIDENCFDIKRYYDSDCPESIYNELMRTKPAIQYYGYGNPISFKSFNDCVDFFKYLREQRSNSEEIVESDFLSLY